MWLSIVGLSAALVITPIQSSIQSVGLEIPWQTFSGAARAAQGSTIGRCMPSGAEILIQRLIDGDDAHIYYFEPESQRIMWVYFKHDGPEANWIGTGRVADSPRHDTIPAMIWYDLPAAKRAFPGGPCDYLVPKAA